MPATFSPVTLPDVLFTLGDLIDAIEKNGFKQAFGHLMASKTGSAIAKPEDVEDACALGQGMINLGLSCVQVQAYSNVLVRFTKRVAYLNDDLKLTPDEIAKMVREEFNSLLSTKLNGWSLGNRPDGFYSSIR